MSKHSPSSIERARIQSLQTAAREHARLRTNVRKRIDIFNILHQRDIWIMYQPLDLYGAFLSVGESSGILINVKHPPNLQRYTAAHEYGHIVMKHGPCLMEYEEEMLQNPYYSSQQEIEAQTFAAHFLMPEELINFTLMSMGFPRKPENITPDEAYQLSLEFGVSYIAVINHLVALKKIRDEVGGKLRQIQPKTIKGYFTNGSSRPDNRADVWALYERDKGRSIEIYVDDEVHIYLNEPSNSEHGWSLAPSESDTSVKLIDSYLEISTRKEDHLTYQHHFVFLAQLSGTNTVHLYTRHGKHDTEQAEENFEVQIRVSPRPTQGVSEQQKILLGDSF